MYNYKIKLILAANRKFDSYAKTAIEDAVNYFNSKSKSKIIENPKEIKEYYFGENDWVLYIFLTSEEKLPTPSKGLRMLSQYLAKGCMEQYIYKRQLFRTSEAKLCEEKENKREDSEKIMNESLENGTIKRLQAYLDLLQKKDPLSSKKIEEIDMILELEGKE